MASRAKSLPRWVGGCTAALLVAVLLVAGNPLTTTPAVAALALSLSRRLRGREHPGLRSERGSVMVEVMVGTLLLAMTTAAVLDGMDGAQRVGRENRDRSAAATLAQQDLERLRSMPPSILANLRQTRTVAVAGVAYTVTSRADWVRDETGIVSCTSDQSQVEYLKLTSTAHSPASAGSPVTATSLLTPPPGIFGDDKGTAAVKVTDRDGEPIANRSIALVGSTTYTASTNELGCAIFAFVPEGNWEAQVSGLVDWLGRTPAESSLTVAEDKTSLTHLEVDSAGSLRARFLTPDGQAAAWASVSVSNSKLPNGTRTFEGGSPFTSKDADGLFPFLDGYAVFAGTCIANNPAQWDPNYYATSGYGFADLSPGELLEPVDVMMPLLRVSVGRTGSTAGFQAVRVRIRQIDAEQECEDVVYDTQVVTGSWTAGQRHAIATPLPFGHYQVCAAYRTSSSGSSWRQRKTGSSGMPADPDLTTAVERDVELAFSTSTSGGTTTGDCDPW